MICSKCGKENDSTVTFCGGCGNNLTAAMQPQATQPQAAPQPQVYQAPVQPQPVYQQSVQPQPQVYQAPQQPAQPQPQQYQAPQQPVQPQYQAPQPPPVQPQYQSPPQPQAPPQPQPRQYQAPLPQYQQPQPQQPYQQPYQQFAPKAPVNIMAIVLIGLSAVLLLLFFVAPIASRSESGVSLSASGLNMMTDNLKMSMMGMSSSGKAEDLTGAKDSLSFLYAPLMLIPLGLAALSVVLTVSKDPNMKKKMTNLIFLFGIIGAGFLIVSLIAYMLFSPWGKQDGNGPLPGLGFFFSLILYAGIVVIGVLEKKKFAPTQYQPPQPPQQQYYRQ